MTKLVMGLGGAALAALATVLAVALAGTPDSARMVATLPPPAADVSGPCDEAEHVGDPRCAGTVTRPHDDDGAEAEVEDRPKVDDDVAADDRREPGEDVRGRCDEAEHANDPRCTGAVAAQPSASADDGDRRGHDATDDHGGHSGSGGGSKDDRSGSNPGRG